MSKLKLENWKDVPGWEKYYQVSNTGRIKSKRTGKIMKPFLNKRGYLQITLQDKTTKRKYKPNLNRVVAMAFLPDFNERLEVNHIDGNKQNNFVENLEMTTRRQNLMHALDSGHFKHYCETHPLSKMTNNQVIEARKMYLCGHSFKKIKMILKIDAKESTIEQAIKGRSYRRLKPSLNDLRKRLAS